MSRYYAVISLVRVTDDLITHEQLYELFPQIDVPGVEEVYTDIDPEWKSYPVLAENAVIEGEN
jgi:hypothetical protein